MLRVMFDNGITNSMRYALEAAETPSLAICRLNIVICSLAIATKKAWMFI
ncbi:hypothetical protein LMG28688_01405 [Paraburkholderia caffeinitolerans]|uniref:Uncharacterized protein n=1 Tax=Paraburkholderia caffeinitolerans TaxID=1723730 RepID=A0A6J5FNL0_9BURK|nr:hypothetical protein LMG28688_01405 [Paraburkholderia caffeinitolerans]